MKVETKYNVGDIVWFLFSNKVETGKVNAIKTFSDSTSSYESYNITIDQNRIANNIEKMFSSKEELLKSL